MSMTVTREAWRAMVGRCYDPKHHKYERYGKRGITVCPEWRSSYSTFARDMGPKPSPVHTVDRKDPDGNYEKENCRWATPLEQRHNRSAIQKSQRPWQHGRSGYTNHGCRCDICKTANTNYMRDYYKPNTIELPRAAASAEGTSLPQPVH